MKTRTSNNPPLRSASSTPDEESPDTSRDALPLKHGLRHLGREPRAQQNDSPPEGVLVRGGSGGSPPV